MELSRKKVHQTGVESAGRGEEAVRDRLTGKECHGLVSHTETGAHEALDTKTSTLDRLMREERFHGSKRGTRGLRRQWENGLISSPKGRLSRLALCWLNGNMKTQKGKTRETKHARKAKSKELTFASESGTSRTTNMLTPFWPVKHVRIVLGPLVAR